MTVKEFYEVVGGNYNKIIENLKKDDRILHFTNMFLEDNTFHELDIALKEKKYEEAFKAAHKLKGVCQNMYFDKMAQVVSEITEGLRNESDVDKAESLFPELEKIYRLTIDSISQIS